MADSMKTRRAWLALVVALLLALTVTPTIARADGPFVLPESGNFITTFCLFADGFNPYEDVALWVELANGEVQAAFPVSTGLSNAAGQLGPQESDLFAGFACFFDPGDGSWVNGQTRIVARGLRSGHEASAFFMYYGQAPDPDGAGVHVSRQDGPPVDTPWFVSSGSGMLPFSRVSIWLGQPDGTSIPNPFNSVTFANERGQFFFTVFRGPLKLEGTYRVVASDGHNEYWSSFDFFVNDTNRINYPTGAKFIANPAAGPYGTFFVNTIGGFAPFEFVDVWIELSNGGIVSLGYVADENGVVEQNWQSFAGEPVGDYYVHARGRTSKVQVDGKFTVIDMVPSP